MRDHGLIDIWWLVNPRRREYFFLFYHRGTQSRIDYFINSNQLKQVVLSNNIGAISLTQHTMLDLQLELQEEKASRGDLCFLFEEGSAEKYAIQETSKLMLEVG